MSQSNLEQTRSGDRLSPSGLSATPEFDVVSLLDRGRVPGRDNAPTGAGAEVIQPLMLCQATDVVDRGNTASDAATAVNVATGGRYGNNPFFNPSSGALGLATGFDVSPTTIAGWVRDSFDRIAVLNEVLGGSRPADFRPINGHDGRPAVCRLRPGESATVPFVIDGRNTPVSVDLPGFRGNAVCFVTDGRRILAIDPRNNDTWQLQRDTLFGATTGYSWTQLRRR